MSSLPERLRKLRNEHKMTQQDVADRLEMTRQAYGYYESQGKDRREPSHETTAKLAEIFSVSIDYLINGKPDKTIEESNSNLFFFDKEGLTEEDLEYLEQSIEIMKERARKRAERKNKK